jgi:hypothetical protein
MTSLEPRDRSHQAQQATACGIVIPKGPYRAERHHLCRLLPHGGSHEVRRQITCARYDRATDSFIDVPPSSVRIEE